MEQIFVLFNPSIQLQSNDNPVDWTSVFEVELTDIVWSSRGIPAGVDENLDIATLTFSIPIWISPPAKVKRQTIIQQIIADVHSTSSIQELGFSEDYHDFFGSIDDTAEIIVTPGDYAVQIAGAVATLVDQTGSGVKWKDIIEMQGSIRSTSLLKLNISNDSDSAVDFIIGTVSYNPTDDTKLIFNLDTATLPTNTLTAVNKIIDPRANVPGDGTLAAASTDQRYLITEDISASGYPDWNIDAQADDIIQYNGSNWIVVFDASAILSTQYVSNSFTSTQYRWTGKAWISSYEGEYNPAFWRLAL
jgi:hypothetical protein